jgi:hypothetical protein
MGNSVRQVVLQPPADGDLDVRHQYDYLKRWIGEGPHDVVGETKSLSGQPMLLLKSPTRKPDDPLSIRADICREV